MEKISLGLNDMKKITTEMEGKICKISLENWKGTGFFCSIPSYQSMKVLITASHIVDGSIKKINFTINNDKICYCLQLDQRKLYIDKKYDITVIEIKPTDGISEDSFFEFDFGINSILDKGTPIYLLSYENAEEVKLSTGNILSIKDFEIFHDCKTANGSAGGPLINLLNHKVIGMHKARMHRKDFKIGTLIKEPLENFMQEYNN